MRSSKRLLFLLPLILLSSCSELWHNYRYPKAKQATQSDGLMPAARFGVAAVRGTALSALRRPATTIRLGGVVLWERPHAFISGNFPRSGGVEETPAAPPGSDAFERALDEAGLPQPMDGKLTCLTDGKRFFPEFERLIKQSRESIDVQAYIFDNDEIAVRCADLLKSQSEQVDVRVIFDELGSTVAAASAPETPARPGFVAPSSISDYMSESSKVQVRSSLNPWLVCDHTKLQVFDHRIAMIGCANIGQEYHSEWHDLMLRAEGPVVAGLQEDFNRTWKRAHPLGFFGDSRKAADSVPQFAPIRGGFPIRIIRTDPMAGRFEIRTSMLLAIRSAKKRIWIENPYIAYDDITDALEDAVRRGVDVRAIYPGENDSKIMDIANEAFADQVVRAGGKAYAYPGMTHLKVMICDNWACVGSANLDTLSMRINRELNLAFRDPAMVEALADAVFKPDFRISKRQRVPKETSPVKAVAETVAETVADQL
jgi:cardiolipin synthase A/B